MKKILMLAFLTASILVLVNLTSIIGHQVSASKTATKQPAQERLGLNNHISVRAAGRGAPRVNLRDGYDVPTVYTGAALDLLAGQSFSPSSLASGDYDEDGVPDLIGGYRSHDGGAITLHRGNVDSIYPNSPEAQKRKATSDFTDAAFLQRAEVYEIAEAPDFLGAGDFDADSHWDVVAASRGGGALYLLTGDGQGRFGPPRRIELPGRVTAMVTGEVNRSDGLADVAVAINGADGPKALVFEGPEGALRSKPETFSLPAVATALALGHLDDDYAADLAVGAGSELLIVRGRDRKLSLDKAHQAEASQAIVNRRSLPSGVVSIAVGDFQGDHRKDLALLLKDGSLHLVSKAQARKQDAQGKGQEWKMEALMAEESLSIEPSGAHLVCAQVSGFAKDDLLVSDRSNRKLHILADDAGTGSRGDTATLSASRCPRILVSLDVEGEPMAVLPMRLNADAMSDLVILRSGHSLLTVVPSAPAATLIVNSAADDDDGACAASPGDCTLREAINAANASAAPDTINFNIGSGAQTINVAAGGLPTINNAGGPLTIDGATQPGFAGTPIIELNGSGALSFVNGLIIDAAGCTVRGLAINRFNGEGIRLFNAQNGVIEGNFIGTDITGTVDLGNNSSGLTLQVPITGLTIGGTTAQARNLISGNTGTGIALNSSSGIVVQGNFIGTDITGAVALGNGFLSSGAVNLDGMDNSVIGGMTAGAGNLISGNNNGAVQVVGSGSGNVIQGNIIGLDITGSNNLGNFFGVIINASSNTVGGTTAAARNIISGNNGDGINIALGNLNLVQGNFIGSDASGTLDRGNTGTGVAITAADTAIGGTVVGARNIISGNNGAGVAIGGQAATGNQVQGNFIGIQADGASPLGNGSFGVGIGEFSFTFANNNTVGGTSPGARNRIAFNGGDGVFIAGGTGNAIRSNSIFSNTELGIDLGADGVSGNDSCDPDIGANNLQNFPVLTSAISTGGSTNIQGTLNSTAGTTFTLEFFSNAACDGSGNGEGQTFIGSSTVTTDGSCNAIINVTLPVAVSGGQFIIATATDLAGNTSEFSQCIQSTGVCVITCPPNQTANTGQGSTQCGAAVNYPTPTTTGGCGTVTCAPSSGSLFPVGTTTVNCTTTAGPSCSFTVTVIDNTAPAITCPANVTTTATSGQCASVVNYTTPTATDNCPGATVVCAPPSDTSFPVGVTTVTCAATDASNNIANCSFTVTVNDTQLPTITCPNNINATAQPGQCSGPVSYTTPAANDNCAGATVACLPPSGSTFAAGATTVTCTATDASNLTANCSFTVTINPNLVITPTSRNHVASGGPGTVDVTAGTGCNWTGVSNNAFITINSGASGAGNGMVNYSVAANTGAARTGTMTIAGRTFTVTQDGATGCTITCPAVQPVEMGPGATQCGAVVDYPAPATSGSCSPVTCAPASGSFFPVGTTTVTCASSGGPTCAFTITVNDTQPPSITCPANVPAVTDQNACQNPTCQVVNYPPPVASDNCPGVTVVCNPPAGSCFPTGGTTVTCTATDTSGNTASCSFTVTTFDVALQDDSNPSIILLWNSTTGQYRFCCNGITFTGVGNATRHGCVYTLRHNPHDRRVMGRVDKAAHAGSASIQAPAGTIRCTITDRNTLNDTNLASCQ